MDFSKLFDKAVSSFLDLMRRRAFELQSEKDIQALIFHYTITISWKCGVQPMVHAEPTRARLRPDLVLGDNEVFMECKLSKADSGGYSEAIKSWRADVKKLRKYHIRWPESRCVMLGIDEAGYHSSPSSENYFDPRKVGLKGTWSRLGTERYYLLGEL